STTANVFWMAAEELDAFDKITVIDSENLSTGIGLQVIEAAILAGEGKSVREIEARIMEIRPRVRASFVVDSLEYLRRGGRCSSVAAFAGSMLKLHPRIVVMDGAMSADKKYRGKYRNILLNYAKEMEDNLRSACPDRVFVTHSGCDEEDVQLVVDYLEGLGIFKEVLVTRAGGVISSHCGPSTLGVLYILKREQERF
ncbi:MAG: DegV family EDD domain-containing protein, partial [Eubacterium sp.]|nr:DegV family EDD domain-containing protein [Eubacterium sp.]